MRLVLHLTLSFLAILAPAATLAAPPTEGRWVLRAAGRPILLLELRKDPAAKGGWSGSFTRPRRFESSSNFSVFSKVEGPATSEVVVDSLADADSLQLTVKDSRNELTHFLWTPSENGGGSLKFTDFHYVVDLAPAATDERVSDMWDRDRAYSAMREWPDNAEMAGIFEADQKARENPSTINWPLVGKDDAARKARTKVLLDSGQLRSGTDFYYAAFIYQHGSSPNDCLMAHTLAVIAAARGRSDATWIASATLDRYLQAIGQKQIYGTQFTMPKSGPSTQEPYDRELVPDALRQALGVPPIAQQEKQRAEYDAEKR